MRMPDVHETLQREVATLPEPLAREALDLVLFVKARHAEEAALWSKVQEARAHRADHPEEVVEATADEWDAATAHVDEEP